MSIVSFISDDDVITAILRHLRDKGRDPRVPPRAGRRRAPATLSALSGPA